MRSNKYIINFKNTNSSAIVEYNDLGYLISFELDPGQFQAKHYEFLFKYFPKKQDQLIGWRKAKFKNVHIKEIEPDLSFKAFYDKYNHKVSKRKVAEKIWQGMEGMEKAKAIAFIAQYENYLKLSGINKQYPETYLRSDMWNN